MTTMLDSTTLTQEELKVALKGEEIEIDFESFLVMVDAVEMKEQSSGTIATNAKPSITTNIASAAKSKCGLVVAPFKPPSIIAKVVGDKEQATTSQKNETIAKFSSKVKQLDEFCEAL